MTNSRRCVSPARLPLRRRAVSCRALSVRRRASHGARGGTRARPARPARARRPGPDKPGRGRRGGGQGAAAGAAAERLGVPGEPAVCGGGGGSASDGSAGGSSGSSAGAGAVVVGTGFSSSTSSSIRIRTSAVVIGTGKVRRAKRNIFFCFFCNARGGDHPGALTRGPACLGSVCEHALDGVFRVVGSPARSPSLWPVALLLCSRAHSWVSKFCL